ncbi:conserved protein of unknown function (DUF 1850) [Magnetospirillum sp. XM-1]|uniref:DUF1850 domain-containing protein n=1 Tax=Magnetospirillum sp. XM-1 TaxID=1663591 RepID=UPI00073DBBC6|nr:DUF1850 domain-containing protein [Magnetospirillum sp. XM-1]CUW41680.1 conserved protein of unknown function (DUF 1850) [Magnetospirillum sp. XM-1]
MSGLCAVLAAGLAVVTPADHFTLAWTHSVEKVEWREDWRVEAGRLHLDQASVMGSGAGMEPPLEAVLRNGRWVWHPGIVMEEIVLARSDFTDDWRLCVGGHCLDLAQEKGQTRLRACP